MQEEKLTTCLNQGCIPSLSVEAERKAMFILQILIFFLSLNLWLLQF